MSRRSLFGVFAVLSHGALMALALGCHGSHAARSERRPAARAMHDDVTRLRRTYGAHANEVFGAAADDFRSVRATTSRHREGVAMRMPTDASGEIRMRLDDGVEIGVVEEGAFGAIESVSGTSTFARRGGRAYWTRGPDGRGHEEWLELDAGIATAERAAVTWVVRDGTPRRVGDSVVVSDREGRPRLRVTAPRAYDDTGRLVGAELRVDGNRIALHVDADGAAVLVDPWWVDYGPAEIRTGIQANVLPDGRVLLVGTGSRGEAGPSVEIFDPTTNTIGPGPSLIRPRRSPRATLLTDGKVFVVGGVDGANAPVLDPEIFDPTTNTWSLAARAPRALRGATATTLADGRVFIYGGGDDQGEVTGVSHLYDPISNTWSAAARAPAMTGHATTLLLDGRVIASGGYYVGWEWGSWGDGWPVIELSRSSVVYDPAADAWASPLSIGPARSVHPSIRLTDGRVLIVGGEENPDDLAFGASLSIFDPATNTWAPGLVDDESSRPEPLPPGTTSLLANGKVLWVGQYYGPPYLFDPATETWTKTSPMVSRHEWHSAAVLHDGRVLVVDGRCTGTHRAEIYDPGADSWSVVGETNDARSSHTANSLPDGRVLVAGGDRFGETLATAVVYDGASGLWTSTDGLATARKGHTATTLADGRVLVVGGLNGSSPLASSEIYDPTTGTWSSGGVLAAPRYEHTATLLAGGQVLLLGGYSTTGGYTTLNASVELYDPSTNTWSGAAAMNLGRVGYRSTGLADGTALVITGNYQGGVVAQRYHPTTNTWTATSAMSALTSVSTFTRLLDDTVLLVGYDLTAHLYDPTSNTWASTAPPRSRVDGRVATLLSNGNVLLTGAKLVTGVTNVTQQAPAEIFDAAAKVWRQVEPAVWLHAGHTATLLPDATVMVLGSPNGGACGNSNWEILHLGCALDNGGCDANTACVDTTRAIVCGACPAGMSSSTGTGNSACTPCPSGTYASATGSTACTPCSSCSATEEQTVACSASTDTACAPRMDAGVAVDASVAVDAGGAVDASVAVDAGGAVDASVVVDAGVTVDADGALFGRLGGGGCTVASPGSRQGRGDLATVLALLSVIALASGRTRARTRRRARRRRAPLRG